MVVARRKPVYDAVAAVREQSGQWSALNLATGVTR